MTRMGEGPAPIPDSLGESNDRGFVSRLRQDGCSGVAQIIAGSIIAGSVPRPGTALGGSLDVAIE